MRPHRYSRILRPARHVKRSSYSHRLFRRTQLESLEERRLLSGVPALAEIQDVTLLAGAPLHVALDGADADGDALSFSADVEGNADLSTFIPEGNRSLRISVADYGDMIFELFEGRVPGVTDRIIELAEDGFYDGLTFHRIIETFMTQGGDPDGDGSGGPEIEFDDEFHIELMHTSFGVLAMAKSGDDTNGSQFYITAAPTRHLDFNHSVFGRLTEGDDVRQNIAGVATGTNDKPLVDVVMSSVDVFTDVENGVLMLSAPEGATGEADVTVTVDDGNGQTAQRTFHVTILPDAEENNSYPFLQSIPPLETTADSPVQFVLPGVDAEGDPILYGGDNADNPDLQVTVGEANGLVTIAPVNGLVGVHEILVYLRAEEPAGYNQGRDVWDSQLVPLYITPAAPTEIELLDTSGTGSSDAGLTNRNNLNGNTLSFRVSGVVEGAEVTLFAGGVPIAQATVSGTSGTVVITTDGTTELADGTHTITALQALRNLAVNVGNLHDTINLSSDISTSIDVSVDTVAPEFTSVPVTDAVQGKLYGYDAQTDDEAVGLDVAYDVANPLSGMGVGLGTGRITWIPQTWHGPTESITITATDAAGNVASQSFDIQVTQPAALDPIEDQNIAEGSLLSFTVTASNLTAPVEFSIFGEAPTGVTINPITGEFIYRPSESQGPGQYDITIRATDTNGTIALGTVAINVTEVNLPPVLFSIPHRTISEGDWLDFVLGVIDVDRPENDLTFELLEGPAGANLSEAGRFTWQADESQGGGTFSSTVRVTDSAGASDEKSFTVTVLETDQPPQFEAVATQVLEPGEELRLLVHATDPDQPSHPITYSLGGDAPEGAVIDPDTGLLTWTVPEDFGSATVRLRVRATEWPSPGQAGLSSEALVEVIVSDFQALMLDLTLNGPLAGVGPIMPAETLPDGLFATFTSPQPLAGASLRFDFQPMAQFSNSLGDTGLFGTQIGPDTSLSGSWIEESDEEDRLFDEPPLESPPKTDDGEDDEQEGRKKVKSSGGRMLYANDEALESLLEDDELPAENEALAALAAE